MDKYIRNKEKIERYTRIVACLKIVYGHREIGCTKYELSVQFSAFCFSNDGVITKKSGTKAKVSLK